MIFDCGGDDIVKAHGGSIFAWAVGEDEGLGEVDILHCLEGELEVGLCFAGEADDDICADGDCGDGGAKFGNFFKVLRECVAAVHPAEDSV